MKLINALRAKVNDFPFQVMWSKDNQTYLESMEKVVVENSTDEVILVGIGTSGATIGTWLQMRAARNYSYVQIAKADEFRSTHRATMVYNHDTINWSAPCFIVDDHVVTGATLARVLEVLSDRYSPTPASVNIVAAMTNAALRDFDFMFSDRFEPVMKRPGTMQPIIIDKWFY